ncbi:MFS transporter [Motilibacter aurantiacus]|uniref:MFS transporter n=1 Tax=Motilibacter aurantiacus TaxID=2714955 RepID=UPI00140B1118|nr:MFS transporter [Motilibacter aurantiacus]NHC45713.1 CynX/NimT family MFS transporter [Motilibacter aurantiacus]
MTTTAPIAPAVPARSTRTVLLVVGILLIGANMRASLTSVGPLLDDIRLDTGLSSAAGGLLTALPLLAFALLSPVAPVVAMRVGMERTLWGALLLLTVGIVLRSTPVTGAIWAGTALLGCAISFFNVLLPSLVKRDFAGKAALVIGSYAATQTVVGAVASGIAVPMAGDEPDGWRLALGFWAGASAIAAAFWLPQLRSTTRPQHARAAALDPHPEYRSPWRSAMGWQVTAFMGLHSLVFYDVIAWLPSIVHDEGISETTAGWYLFVYQVVAVLSNLSTPFLMRRFPDQRTLGALCSTLILVGTAGLLVAPGAALLWVVFAGLGAGVALVLTLTLFGLRTVHHGQAAALSGMAQCVGYTLAAAGPVVIGALHDATDGWTVPLALLTALAAVQVVFAVLAGRQRVIG